MGIRALYSNKFNFYCFCINGARFPYSVLRIWDVLLFQGNRVMLFRTALALLEIYGITVLTQFGGFMIILA